MPGYAPRIRAVARTSTAPARIERRSNLGAVSTGVPGVRAAAADPHPGSCWTTTAYSTTGPARWSRSPPDTTRTVANHVATVRPASHRLALSASLIAEATRVSALPAHRPGPVLG